MGNSASTAAWGDPMVWHVPSAGDVGGAVLDSDLQGRPDALESFQLEEAVRMSEQEALRMNVEVRMNEDTRLGAVWVEADLMCISFTKGSGDKLGVDLGNRLDAEGGAVILRVHDDLLAAMWNESNPGFEVLPGMIVVQANGLRGYWDIVNEIKTNTYLELAVQLTPPGDDYVQSFRAALQGAFSLASPFRLRFNAVDENGELNRHGHASDIVSLPSLRAGSIGAAQCSICIEEIEPDDEVVQLPCGHAYHPFCVARWLTQSRDTCPLCVRPVSARNA